MTGLKVTVHYKEYKGALPWRGYEKAIVDKVEGPEEIAKCQAICDARGLTLRVRPYEDS